MLCVDKGNKRLHGLYSFRDRGRKMLSGPECMSLLLWLSRSCRIKVEQDKDIETSLSFF